MRIRRREKIEDKKEERKEAERAHHTGVTQLFPSLKIQRGRKWRLHDAALLY